MDFGPIVGLWYHNIIPTKVRIQSKGRSRHIILAPYFLVNSSTTPCLRCPARCTGFDVAPTYSIRFALPAMMYAKSSWPCTKARQGLYIVLLVIVSFSVFSSPGIEKLDIRVRFDTDPEIIRKIIKKINKAMRQDEEYSRVLLSDIKPSGVRTMDDSAMIMRVKFKCIPGEQFVVRRQVYQRLREAFKEQGIEFAHRNVTVYLPPQPTSGSSAVTPNTLEAAGAAAAAIVQADEEKALKQAEAKKKPL